MTISAEQKIERKNHLGSSDMAAICGVDPWRTSYDVWLSKTGQLVDQTENVSMQIGTFLEDGVLNFAEDRLGEIRRNVPWVCQKFPVLMSNIDGIVMSSGEPVEAKTAGILSQFKNDAWGADETDEVPDHVIVQSHVHMLCLNRDICHVPALIGGRGLCMFHVPFNDKLGEIILDKAEEFWRSNVLEEIAPVDSQPHIEVLKRIKRQPNKIVDIDPALLQAWLDAKEAKAEVEKYEEETKEKLIAALADAEGANAGQLGTLSYYEQVRKAYTVKESSYRVLRFKKA